MIVPDLPDDMALRALGGLIAECRVSRSKFGATSGSYRIVGTGQPGRTDVVTGRPTTLSMIGKAPRFPGHPLALEVTALLNNRQEPTHLSRRRVLGGIALGTAASSRAAPRPLAGLRESVTTTCATPDGWTKPSSV
jgi:hypothetical protein